MIVSPTRKPSRIPLPRGELFGLLLVLVLAIHPAEAKKGDSSKESARVPKLSLASTPAFGFAPVTVQLVASLTGIDPGDPNFCHAAIAWVRIDPGASPEKETRFSETPRCVHGESESSVATTFSKAFELDRSGSYLYRVSVVGKNGKEVRSNYVTIKVLRVP